MKKNLCIKIVCIIKVVLKKYSSTVVRENLYIKFICYVKVMLRIHPSKVYKMLYVKVVFTSSHFHKRKVCEEKKNFPKKDRDLLSEIARHERSWRALAD